MSNSGSRFHVILLAASALGGIPSFAMAQGRVPTREGNIWNGLDHEPVPSLVHRDEEAAGIAQPPAQREQTTDDVESLYRQLMSAEQNR